MKSLLIAFVVTLTLPGFAQFSEKQEDMSMTSSTRAELIDSIISKVKNEYVFLEKTDVLEKALRSYEKDRMLTDSISSISFRDQINLLLLQASNDKHLQLLYSHEPVPQQNNKEAQLPEFITRFAKEHNYGFSKLEILEGNIGYMNILGFFPFKEARSAAVSAFQFVENTVALIVDLRRNNGGESNMAGFVTSYFFDEKPVNVLSTHFRKDNRVEKSWTDPKVPGKRYLNRPIFILTSSQTFSAGEAMAFAFQSFKKATIVGETTGGGANICDLVRLNDHFMINLPIGYPSVPGTKKNWDGIGVIPDIKCSSDKALEVAVKTATSAIHP
jgi:C-terminal processing protease CtpA/Prc